MLEIEEACEQSQDIIKILSCGGTIIGGIICIGIIIGSIYCIRKMYIIYKLSFEIIPMATTLIQAILQLTIFVINHDLRIQLASLYFQLFTFSIVSFSFSGLYLKIKEKQMYCVIIFQIFYLVFINILLFLTIFNVISFECEDSHIGFLIPLINLILNNIICLIFGIKLLGLIKESLKDGYNPNYSTSLIINQQQPNYPSTFQNDQKKQIKFIIITFIITVISQIFMGFIRYHLLTIKDGHFLCEEKYDMDASSLGGKIYITFQLIINLVPCTLVPYAFYYQPLMKKKGRTMHLEIERILSLNKTFFDQRQLTLMDIKQQGQSN